MQARFLRYVMIFTGLALLSGSCSNTRFLTDNQVLYTGKKTVVVADSVKKPDFNVRQKTESVTAYKPNNSLAGKRLLPPFGLWIYNYMKPKKNPDKPGWFFKTFSREPVLISKVNPETRCLKLESELFNIGYFHSKVWSTVDSSRKNRHKAGITYYIKPGQPFRYREIYFEKPEAEIDSILSKAKADFPIKPDDIFNLDAVKSEAKRISGLALEDGYFYFNTSQIKWTADTTQNPYSIYMKIGRNRELRQNADRKYTIGEISVRINRQSDTSGIASRADTLLYDGIYIVSQGTGFKPDVIARSIYFRKGDTYSASAHNKTIAHLNSYGVFKFINIEYVPDPDTLNPTLGMRIDLTPLKNIGMDLEANVASKSTGFSGPGVVATLSHGNLSGEANKLQLKLNGGFEWQWSNNSGSTLGTTSYNIGLSSSLIFPKMLLLPHLFEGKAFKFPKTSLTLGFELLNKIQYYKMSSVNLGLGYQWKKSERVTHVFYPLFFNSVALLKTTPEFDSILLANPYIRKSFEEQFIGGTKYDFIYNNNLENKPHGFYFQGGVNTAGNIFDLVKRVSSKETERPYSVAGNVYSQFIKFATDFRYYRNFMDKNLVFRLYAGLGIPYSNSVAMPYVEQFYSGGSNSIRAFVARSIGPGSLTPDYNSEIIDQTGDIKLEGNIEYRFRISKILRGALFVDSGNIWLLNPDESRPGAEFHVNSFIDQLAVGTGFGFRFDFGFFLLRTDLGFPVRRAYSTEGSNWLGSTRESIDNMIFNLAIGYPF